MLHAGWILALTLALHSAPGQDAAAPDRWADSRPITRLPQNLAHDVKALPSIGTIALLAAGTAGSLSVHPSDDNVSNWALREGAAGYTSFGRVLGDGWVQGGAALGTYAIGRMTGNQTTTHIGGDLIRAQILNGVITTTLKSAVSRHRPSGGLHAFPSGHSSATFASAAVLQSHFGWKAGAPAYAVAGLVGWTRVRDRAHWMSDVVFGATIGTIAGRSVGLTHGRRQFAIAPGPGRSLVVSTRW